MCSYSMIADHYNSHFQNNYPQIFQNTLTPAISRAEFDALRAEVENLKELLKKAKEYDERTGQPDCESADKVAILRKVAELVGIDIESALPHS